MFAQVQLQPADPILGLIDAFNQDTRTNKLDLGVGVYKDAQGGTPILESVLKAEDFLLKNSVTKTYFGSHGDPIYGQEILKLAFGANAAILDSGRASVTQAPGGTGALRLAAELIKQEAPQATVWISNPSWANHQALMSGVGLATAQYAYVDAASNSLDFAGMLASLKQIRQGDVVLLHTCCHNPTGFDLTPEQWREVLAIMQERQLIPLLDSAYLGFGAGLEEDAYALRLFSENLPEVLIAFSCSKNFGIYRERTGALIALTADAKTTEKVRSQIAKIARINYSNPPAHGSSIVATILTSPELNQLWRSEVDQMRNNISQLRQDLVQALEPFGLAQRFACITQQNGMFSFTGLQPNEVAQLREEFAIYMVGNGRINIAGYNASTLNYLRDALVSVCKASV